ncbi:MAG: ABC transporter ATP-binding protein [Candidatus Rokubacteria bacterium]|nr:ABC transporter ATP-binding protein [Candidatus Rokubacteria bacterium]
MPPVLVELREVAKAYEGHAAVRGLSLAVEAGERLALLGPSGCGKTTTLNLIAGFLEPDTGSIVIGGRPMAGIPPHRRDTAMVFQSYALFPHLSVFDNLAFGLRMRRVARAEIATRVRETLELVQMAGLERRYPRELSGGQQQRVALARALVIRPGVLLLDEPLSNLDAKLRQEMRLEIVEIQRRLGITTVFVTHDQEEALSIADRIAVMSEGRIEQIDGPIGIYHEPRTEFVARFIGDGNFLPGQVAGVEDGQTRVDTAAGLPVRAARGRQRPGDAVVAMVRPEKTRVTLRPERLENSFTATVRAITFLGPVTRYQLLLRDMAFAASLPDASHLAGVEPGATVHVGWRAADCLLLDPAVPPA